MFILLLCLNQSVSKLPNPTSDIQRCERSLISRQTLHFQLISQGSDPSNSEVWIQRPGHIVVNTSWYSNATRRLTKWKVAMEGSKFVGYDPVRNWSFVKTGKTLYVRSRIWQL